MKPCPTFRRGQITGMLAAGLLPAREICERLGISFDRTRELLMDLRDFGVVATTHHGRGALWGTPAQVAEYRAAPKPRRKRSYRPVSAEKPTPFRQRVAEAIFTFGAAGCTTPQLRRVIGDPHVSNVAGKLHSQGRAFRRRDQGAFRYFATKEWADAWVPTATDLPAKGTGLEFARRSVDAPVKIQRMHHHPEGPEQGRTRDCIHVIAPTPPDRWAVEQVHQWFPRPKVPATLDDCYVRSRA